jgi:hypothetical protein
MMMHCQIFAYFFIEIRFQQQVFVPETNTDQQLCVLVTLAVL